jgi:hypothetical protein
MRQPCPSFNGPRSLVAVLVGRRAIVGAAWNVTAPIDPSGAGEAVRDAAARRALSSGHSSASVVTVTFRLRKHRQDAA